MPCFGEIIHDVLLGAAGLLNLSQMEHKPSMACTADDDVEAILGTRWGRGERAGG